MRRILLTAVVMAAFPLVAMAQTDTSTSTGEGVGESVSNINQTFAGTPATQHIVSVPEMGTQIVTPTATCTIPLSGQAVWMGMGVGAGTAYTVEYCKQAEQARQVFNMGDHTSGLMMMCSDPDFRKARALQGPLAACPSAYGASGLTKAQTQAVDDSFYTAQKIARQAVAVAPVCKEVFIPPADPNGAGYLAKQCN